MADLLLRDGEGGVLARVEHRVEHDRDAARDPRVGVVQALGFEQADELAEALVDLLDDRVVEGEAVVEQPAEGFALHAGNARGAQRDHVVAARLGLQQRTFAEPAAGRDAGVGRGLARHPVGGHLRQTVDDADPACGLLALAADEAAGLDATLGHALACPLKLFGLQVLRPARQRDGCGEGRGGIRIVRHATIIGSCAR